MFTKETDYAFRAILYLAEKGEGIRVNAQTIADDMKIPHRFLLKFLQKLKKKNLVQSFMGVNGGYSLAKSPSEISLLDVAEAVDGPIYINHCLLSPELCNRISPKRCPVHLKLYEIQKSLEADLKAVTFASML